MYQQTWGQIHVTVFELQIQILDKQENTSIILTQKAPSMFLTTLPISNTSGSAADMSAIVKFLYHKRSSFPNKYYSNLLTRTRKFQLLCRTKCSALPLLTATWANKTTLLHVGTS